MMDPSGFFRIRPRRRVSSNQSTQRRQQQQRRYRRQEFPFFSNQLPFTELPITRPAGVPRTSNDDFFILLERLQHEFELSSRRYPPRDIPRSQGVDKKTLNSLSTRKLKEDDPLRNENCSICFDSFAEEKIIELPCDHVYHYDCLRKWLNHHDSCPICRAKVSVSSKTNLNSNSSPSLSSSSVAASSSSSSSINDSSAQNNDSIFDSTTNNDENIQRNLLRMQEFVKSLGSRIERQQQVHQREKAELHKIWETLGGWLVDDSVRQEQTIVNQIENLLETTDALRALC